MAAKKAQVAAIASGKGGVGKSTLAVGLGTAAALAGKQVLIVEFDAGLRGVDIMLGLTGIVYDLGDLLEGRCNISSAIMESPAVPGLFVIAAPSSLTGSMELEDIRLLIGGLRYHFDLILMDMPAGLGLSIRATCAAADIALIVATPDPVCIRDGGKVAQSFAESQFDNHRLIINRVNRNLLKRQIIQDLDEVIDGVGSQLIGVVPEDHEIQLASAAGRPAGQKSDMRKVCAAIVKRMTGEYIPLIVT